MKCNVDVVRIRENSIQLNGWAIGKTPVGWQKNETGWWYGTNATGTTWYHDGWQWIDGNKDGISECYYFAPNGYIVTNGKTPDGYDVNADGQWTINGVVQTIGAAVAQAAGQ